MTDENSMDSTLNALKEKCLLPVPRRSTRVRNNTKRCNRDDCDKVEPQASTSKLNQQQLHDPSSQHKLPIKRKAIEEEQKPVKRALSRMSARKYKQNPSPMKQPKPRQNQQIQLEEQPQEQSSGNAGTRTTPPLINLNVNTTTYNFKAAQPIITTMHASGSSVTIDYSKSNIEGKPLEIIVNMEQDELTVRPWTPPIEQKQEQYSGNNSETSKTGRVYTSKRFVGFRSDDDDDNEHGDGESVIYEEDETCFTEDEDEDEDGDDNQSNSWKCLIQ